MYKWLIVFFFTGFLDSHHPIFVSVTEIEHNAAEKTLEISCKIFTDDFETTLRKKYNGRIDLLDAKVRTSMNPIVNDYIQKHLKLVVNGKPVELQFLGFEQEEEGIVSFFEVKNIIEVKKVEVINDLLYEYKPQQMEIMHITVKGERKSSRLNNPDSKAEFLFTPIP
jgi:uncharacterized membrane protein